MTHVKIEMMQGKIKIYERLNDIAMQEVSRTFFDTKKEFTRKMAEAKEYLVYRPDSIIEITIKSKV